MASEHRTLLFIQVFLVVAPAYFFFGYNQSGFSTILNNADLVSHFPQIDTINTQGTQEASNSTKKGTVNASFQLGALLGSLSCSFLGDRLGRRKTIFISALIATIGLALECSTFALEQLVIGRFIIGFSVGLISVIVPVWQAECSSARNRGRQVTTTGLFMAFGFVLASWVNYGFSKVATPFIQWRIPLVISVIFPILMCLSVFQVPESPRWLVRCNCLQEAASALALLKGLSPDDSEVQSELNGIQLSLETTDDSSLLDIFCAKDDSRLLDRLVLCLLIQFFQQMCGGILIALYTTTIFQHNLHLGGDIPKILAATCLTWKFLCSFLSFAAIDRLGRRVVFITSGTGMAVCMGVMAITSSFPTSNKAASIVSAVTIFMFNVFYPIGFLAGNFLYCTEIAPARLRIAMASLSTANHWLWNFIVVMVTPVALTTISWKYYIVFTVVAACIPVTVFFFFPETMNRNLELLDNIFRDAPSIWDIVGMARRLPQGDTLEAEAELQEERKGTEVETKHTEAV
ncbi:unnamed protein product [Penicillium salamii]|uniref:Major facilitator superfamily (MFS) profile domain-containing protein n=1 Tax=Penicillium salamii TaxID=1612424 RepID=A0A9W4IVE8_9EURO|nr:unnamed protein product [Penicillium salamii]CAG8118347.1 unnamed protein product [Penicillium salamii]CAG8294264.1 unnamed protein product [Penicillium salamii]CAG8345570.1 unnamed protein product [Penicillium salamii]CAG8347583.1 unnamed protein product [Penicillium salamii]